MNEYLDWKIGDEVVCVDDEEKQVGFDPKTMVLAGGLDGLTKNTVYTIREFYIDSYDQEVCICLNEIRRGWDEVIEREPGFMIRRFRKAQKRKTNIDVFKAMLNKTPDQNRKEILESGLKEILEHV